MKLPLIGTIPNRVLDERFLDHRRRSSTFAMMAGALLSGGFLEYHLLLSTASTGTSRSFWAAWSSRSSPPSPGFASATKTQTDLP
ncbi:MAG TPA: hypothetical protein VL990_03205 [Acidobacteriaceae bacterium]|nr:hypothetical protein [Acidobacteriaceae bacterium]